MLTECWPSENTNVGRRYVKWKYAFLVSTVNITTGEHQWKTPNVHNDYFGIVLHKNANSYSCEYREMWLQSKPPKNSQFHAFKGLLKTVTENIMKYVSKVKFWEETQSILGKQKFLEETQKDWINALKWHWRP